MKQATLKPWPIQPATMGRRHACGIAVVQCLTGASFDDSREEIITARGTHRMVTGIDEEHVLAAVAALAPSLRWTMHFTWRQDLAKRQRRPTLKTWIKSHADDPKTYLLVAGNHFLVTRKLTAWDSGHMAHERGEQLHHMRLTGSIVTEAWRFEQVPS